MREDTKLLKSKYIYYFYLMDNERFNLFSDLIWDNSTNNYLQILDTDKLINFLHYINLIYHTMISKFHNYISYRSLLMKRFEKKRNYIIKKKSRSYYITNFVMIL